MNKDKDGWHATGSEYAASVPDRKSARGEDDIDSRASDSVG
ncbi:MAG: hypothetical protein PVJ84_12285 [Desulfobacteraceae bacterium]